MRLKKPATTVPVLKNSELKPLSSPAGLPFKGPVTPLSKTLETRLLEAGPPLTELNLPMTPSPVAECARNVRPYDPAVATYAFV